MGDNTFDYAVTERIPVPFEGEGSGEEELAWGQIGLWQSIDQSGQSKTMVHVAELSPGTTVEGMAEVLRFITSRHQSLRTRLRFGADGRPRQVCSTSGETVLEVVDAGDADPATVAGAVSESYQTRHFDYETEWPVRLAVIRSNGVLTHQVLVILHTSIDADGISVLLTEIDALPDLAPVTAMVPLEQARRQASPAGRRQNAASLAYLEKVLRTVSPSRFGEPRHGGERVIHQLEYHSPAALLAVRSVAARAGINTSPVLLASFAVGLARFTGVNPVMAMLMVSNRFRPGFAESVSALIQLTPYLIDVADITLDDAVARAAGSALTAYKNAYYDPYQQDEVIERVERERGEEIDLSCFYNDRRLQDRGNSTEPISVQGIRDALARSTVSWTGELNPPRRKIYFNVYDPPGAIEFSLSADSRYFSPQDMLALVRGIEAVAVEVAVDGGAPTGVRDKAKV